MLHRQCHIDAQLYIGQGNTQGMLANGVDIRTGVRLNEYIKSTGRGRNMSGIWSQPSRQAQRDFAELCEQYPSESACVVTRNGHVDPHYTRVCGVTDRGYVRCYAPVYGVVNPVVCDFLPSEVRIVSVPQPTEGSVA